MLYALLWCAWRYRKKLRIICYFHNHPSRLLLRPAGFLKRVLSLDNLAIAAEDTGLAERYQTALKVPIAVLIKKWGHADERHPTCPL
jgi:hypothetical protein